MADADELEAFIEESILRSAAAGYHPSIFIEMRARWGTAEAIRRLVVSGDIQSGFRRLLQLGMIEWTIEAAAIKFPSIFKRDIREAAQFRLSQAQK